MPNIGVTELVILLVIILLIFGPKRVPELARSLGRGMKEFKDSVTGHDKDVEVVKEPDQAHVPDEAVRLPEGEKPPKG